MSITDSPKNPESCTNMVEVRAGVDAVDAQLVNLLGPVAKVQALTILARKLARVAFALLRNQSEYDPLRRLQTQTLMPC